MDPTPAPISLSRAQRILHFALIAGMTLAGAVFIFLVRVQGFRPTVSRDVGLVLSGIAVGLVVVASTIARRRMPERRFDQTPDAFWANPDARGASIVLWALTEGAGLVGWVGYLLSGATAPAVAAVIAIGALITFRPARLESEGA